MRSQRIVYGTVKMHRSASPISARRFFQECPFRVRNRENGGYGVYLADIIYTDVGVRARVFYVCATE